MWSATNVSILLSPPSQFTCQFCPFARDLFHPNFVAVSLTLSALSKPPKEVSDAVETRSYISFRHLRVRAVREVPSLFLSPRGNIRLT